ncbi:Protein FAR-RED ELONGATED HYPOCOTYL 3 [Bienertia sinuspersici]
MKTTIRVESIHSFFNDYVNKHTRLREFAEQYCEAMEVRAEAEREADSQSASFKEVQRECMRTSYTNFSAPTQISENKVEYLVDDRVWCMNRQTRKEFVTKYKRVYRVVYNTSTKLAECECKLFHSIGIMCRYLIKLYDDMLGMFEILEAYIVRKWRRDVQRKYTRVMVAYHDHLKNRASETF